MNRKWRVLALVLALVLIVSSLALATPAPPALSAYDKKVVSRVDGERIVDHVRALSEEIGPRYAGTPEEEAAAEYIRDVMAGYGYDVTVDHFSIGYEYFVKVVELAPTAREFSARLLTNSGHTDEGGITAPLVDCGLGYPEEIPDDVAGKIALIQRGEMTFLAKAQNAAAKGAAGVLIYNNQPGNFSGTMAENPGIPVASLSREDGLLLKDELSRDEVTMNFTARILKELFSPNVIASRPPEAAKNPGGQVVVISAHLDSAGPGANDNASGVAAALELARILKSYPIERELRFLFFGAEERGLLGSEHYVAGLSEEELARIVAVFNLDMVGTSYGDRSVLTAWTVTGERNIVTDCAVAAGARLGSAVLNSRTTRSDHAPFEYVGVPAATFLRLPMEEVYHTPDDTVEKNISAGRLEDSAEIVGAAAYYLARPQGPALTHSAVAKENLRIFREELDRIIEENKEEYADIYVPSL
ncbi:MAG: aminopeptidase YwaD [Bacillota bacterium]|nr:aminopeptidase YwaD [Bacillota bacterium]